MKTSELQGAALDWAVAKCEGYSGEQAKDILFCDPSALAYSTDWSQGGPIIERERIAVLPCVDERGRYWAAGPNGPNARHEGVTPLIAAMRCYVASKLGDTVDVPEELG